MINSFYKTDENVTSGHGTIKLRQAYFWSKSQFYKKNIIVKKWDWDQKWAHPNIMAPGSDVLNTPIFFSMGR